MTDLIFPPSARVSSSEITLVSNTAVSRSIFTGAVRSVSRGGDRMQISLSTANAHDTKEAYANRALLKAFRSAMRGMANRAYVPYTGYVPRGSFPAPELFSNNTFTSGTTGWNASNSTISATDGMLRLSANGSGSNPSFYQSVALTQYAPHVLRTMIYDGYQTSGLSAGPAINDSVSNQANGYSTSRGYRTATLVAVSASAATQYAAVFASTTGYAAGAYLTIPWCSLSRCALLDNPTNSLIQSDDFTNGSWSNTRSTDSGNTTTAPDGLSTADSIIEDATASSSHYVSQNVTTGSGTQEYAFAVALKASTRTFARIAIREATSSHEAYVDINLTTGALGTPGVTGANMASARAASRDMGNGWWYVSVVGFKASAATTITPVIYTASALGTISYSGDGTSKIFAWRATFKGASTHVALVATTTTAITPSPQSGSSLTLKGLPASTTGLLLAGDLVEIYSSGLHRLTAPLNSDAAGLGYLQIEPSLHTSSTSDHLPVIINTPMARCVMADNEGGWTERPGGFSDHSFVFEESLDA